MVCEIVKCWEDGGVPVAFTGLESRGLGGLLSGFWTLRDSLHIYKHFTGPVNKPVTS